MNWIDPYGLWQAEVGGVKFPLIYNFIDPPKEPLSDAEIALQFLPIGSVGKISGFTKHGLNQAICRDGVGVAPKAMLDAVKNPVRTVEQINGAIKYVGQNATVILNKMGKVITTWARNNIGWRIH